MDASANHAVIVGGPEETDELLAIVLDDGRFVAVARERAGWAWSLAVMQ